MQLLPDDSAFDGIQPVDGEPISAAEIEQMLAVSSKKQALRPADHINTFRQTRSVQFEKALPVPPRGALQGADRNALHQ